MFIQENCLVPFQCTIESDSFMSEVFINVIFSTQNLKEENRIAWNDVCQELLLLYSIWERAVEDSASEVTAWETPLLLFFNEKGEQL